MEAFTRIGAGIASQLQDLEGVVRKEFDDTFSNMNGEITNLVREAAFLRVTNSDLLKENESLRMQVNRMEDEHRNLTRVSHVIALQNENAKLIQEKQKMNGQIKTKPAGRNCSTQTEVVNAVCEADTQTDGGKTEVVEKVDEESNSQKTLEVRAKKIGNTVYYIDTDNNIFSKESDDSIGKCIGYLTKDKDVKKYRAVWHDVSPGS